MQEKAGCHSEYAYPVVCKHQALLLLQHGSLLANCMLKIGGGDCKGFHNRVTPLLDPSSTALTACLNWQWVLLLDSPHPPALQLTSQRC